MKCDLILAGVGGQGILSIAFVLDWAAMAEGLNFKQAEIHGMSQRGGAVQSHLRLSDQPIFSDLIPRGRADMVLSVEPLEALRYLEYLKPDGIVVTNSVPFINIPDYPPREEVLAALRRQKNHLLIEADNIAREAGSARAQNMVVLGAASLFLPLQIENMRRAIRELFQSRGERVVMANLKAFDHGREKASLSWPPRKEPAEEKEN